MRRSLFHLASLLITLAAAYNNTTQSTCNTLFSTLPDDVFYPESDTYNASIASYPFIQLRLHPTCLIQPRNAQDVSTAIKILKQNRHTKFAVRGGGHNANPGFNNIEDGVTIDMRHMNSVEVFRNIVRVGGGAIWQDVYDALDPHNITVLGGRIGVVGVAGFLTGGGISFFSPSLGWACDSVINFQIVLANSSIINAKSTHHASLFAALKGGQSNFGIVTRFDLRSFPVLNIWGGRINFAPEAEIALLDGFVRFKDPANYDEYAAGWTTFSYNGSTGTVTPNTILWYTKPELKPGSLRYLVDVGPQVSNGMTSASVSEFARMGSRAVRAGNSRTIWATTTFRTTPTITHRIHTLWKSLVPEFCKTYAYAHPSSDLTFQSLPPLPPPHSPPNSLGFPPTSSPEKDMVFLQIVFHFDDAGATQGLNHALKRFVEMFDKVAEEEGAGSKWVYLNFAAGWQDPLGGYGEHVVRRLRGVARRYDPGGFWQKQLQGGFKVFSEHGSMG